MLKFNRAMLVCFTLAAWTVPGYPAPPKCEDDCARGLLEVAAAAAEGNYAELNQLGMNSPYPRVQLEVVNAIGPKIAEGGYLSQMNTLTLIAEKSKDRDIQERALEYLKKIALSHDNNKFENYPATIATAISDIGDMGRTTEHTSVASRSLEILREFLRDPDLTKLQSDRNSLKPGLGEGASASEFIGRVLGFVPENSIKAEAQVYVSNISSRLHSSPRSWVSSASLSSLLDPFDHGKR